MRHEFELKRNAMLKKLLMSIAVMVALTGIASAGDEWIDPAKSTRLLSTLPVEAKRMIETVRNSCLSDMNPTSGDEGLIEFTIQGSQAVLVDELNFCSNGECNHGVNCATGFTHDVAIYVRSGKSWRKVLSRNATEKIFLSLDPYTSKFRALVMSVHGGDEGCPFRDKNDPTAWKREKCDFVVKWDGTKFVWKPL
jgi:hypothetical protein